MRETIFIYDASGDLINDPDRSIEYATGLTFSSLWPKGFGGASFTVTRDIAETWAVRMAYELIIRDGQAIVYQGQLGPISKQLRGTQQTITIPALGWYNVLAKRKIRKRWADNAAVDRLIWNKRDEIQKSFQVEKRESDLTVKFAGSETGKNATDRYEERYDMPLGQTVKRLTFTVQRMGGTVHLSGPDKLAAIYNGNGTLEWVSDPVPTTATAVDLTLATPTNRIVIKIGPNEDGLFDELDGVVLFDLTAYSELGSITAGTVIQNVLAMVGGEISTDYSQWTDPALSLIPFMNLSDDYESADKIIQHAVNYGDSLLRTYGFSVWDKFGTSDGLPRSILNYRDTSTYKWIVTLDELSDFQDAESDAELHNYIIVKYQNGSNKTAYRTPDNNTALTDATSVARYGRRDHLLDIGAGDATTADSAGTRYLAYHKDPLRQTSLGKIGRIRNAQGIWTPINRVRAGDAVKVLDYNGGETFWLTKTSYNAETTEMRMEPDLPPDDLVISMLQEKELG